MPDNREKSRGGSGAAILLVLAVLLFLPVLYVLSGGPAIALATRGYMSDEAFEITYYPLILASDRSDWIEQALSSYAELWAAPPTPALTPPAAAAAAPTSSPTPAPPPLPAATSQPVP